jgi:hypothetical protein
MEYRVMKQARLRFYERYISRVDQAIDNALIPSLAVIVLVLSIWNIAGGSQA